MTPDQMVHVVDDDEPVRDSIRFLLASAGLPATTYDGPQTLLNTLSPGARGCIVTDVRMPGMSGIELMERLRAASVSLPVVVITGHGDVPLAVEAMKAGAIDFIEKPFDDDVLIAAVNRALAAGARDGAEAAEAQAARELLDRLTPRERDVFDALIDGHSNKLIAIHLGISPRTVEVHRANLFEKMHAASLPDLVKIGLKARLG